MNEIVRKSPSELKDDDALFAEFCKLLLENVNFVSSMDKTPVDTVRLYSRRITTAAARGDFIRNITTLMRENGADLVVSEASDFKKYEGSLAEPMSLNGDTDKYIIKKLDKDSKESRSLAFFSGALFEATRNVHGKYLNSQTLLMLDVPTQEQVDSKQPIKLYVMPEKSQKPDKLYHDPPPTKEVVENDWGWKEVLVHHNEENWVSVKGQVKAYRKQYPLVHLGNTTVSHCIV